MDGADAATVATVMIAAIVIAVLALARLQRSTGTRLGRGAQRKLDKIRQHDPPPKATSIYELMIIEAAETGVDKLEGAEGVDTSTKLKVWNRDVDIREQCTGELAFEVAKDIDPAEAETKDVWLVCKKSKS